MSHSDSDTQMAYYPIRVVSAETGVNAITLRAWERRYGLITPKRTAKGHRLYTEQDILLIRKVVALLNRGIPISQAQAMLANGEELPDVPVSSRGKPSQWQHYREQLHQAVQDFNNPQLTALFQEVSQFFPLEAALRFLFLPQYRHLQDNVTQTLGMARLRFYAAFLQARLAWRLSEQAEASDSGRPVVLLVNCTWEDDIQQLLLGTLLQQLGLQPMWFSGLLTPQQIGELLQTRRWQAALVQLGKNPTEMQLGQLQRLTQEQSLPLFVYGQPARLQGALLQHGLINLTDDLHDAALTIRDMLLSLEE